MLNFSLRLPQVLNLRVYGLPFITGLFFLLSFQHDSIAQSLNMSLESQWHGNPTGGDVRQGVRYNDIWGYTDDQNNEYAVIGTPQRIFFIDISNPNNPIEKAQFTGGSSTIWRDFKTYDRYTYAVADEGNEGLIIFDMSALPNGNIEKVYQSNSDFVRAHNIYIDNCNGRLYVAGSTAVPANDGLLVYDLTADPANPTLIANVALCNYVHDVFVQSNIAYCSCGNDASLYIYDMSNPSNPAFQGSINTGSYNHSSWITDDGTKLVYAEEVGNRPLGIIDITDPGNMSIPNTFSAPLTNASGLVYHNPFILGNYAIVSSYMDGITMFDITSSGGPTLAGYYDTVNNNDYNPNMDGAWGTYPFFPSGLIVGSDTFTGLYVLSTSLPIPSMSDRCNNGVKDLFEEGIDCGGFCKPCASCSDGVQNQDETGVDCGGANCPACPDCTNGIMDGDETGIDCGGSNCPACPTCADGIMNQDETGVDCGGANCPACPDCTNGIMDGDETGVDCGGANCPTCPCINIRFTITLDDYPEDIDWVLSTVGGTQIGSDGNYSNPEQDFTTLTYDFCVDPGCYNFNIMDEFGDGLCCQEGNGSYSITNEDDNASILITSSGQFGAGETRSFCVAIPETCTDGIMNQDETGIDCGGSCAPCNSCEWEETFNTNVTSGTYLADNAIYCNSTVPAGENVTFGANNFIELQAGFTVEENAELLVTLQGCTSNGPPPLTSSVFEIAKSQKYALVQRGENGTYIPKEGIHLQQAPGKKRAFVSVYLEKAQQIEFTIEGQGTICIRKPAGYSHFKMPLPTLAKGAYKVNFTTENKVGFTYLVIE